MKIEKISETQIKFFLDKNDLNERNITISELSCSSEKTQALFHEMMEQAMEVCGFSTENSPLMIEAVPMSNEGITIIISKVEEKIESTNKLNFLPSSKDVRRFKKKTINESYTYEKTSEEKNIIIYSFENLDLIYKISQILKNIYVPSSLYKYEDKYFLILENDSSEQEVSTDTLELILSEYGKKHISTLVSKYFISEHGEKIIKEDALEKLVVFS